MNNRGPYTDEARALHADRARYRAQFGLSQGAAQKFIDAAFIDQLDACADDSARRLLLECSEPFAPGDQPEAVPLKPRVREAKPVPAPRPQLRRLPPPKPVRSARWTEYGDWSDELGPRVARLMRLAAQAHRECA